MSSDEGGLRRWARRKAEVKQRRGGAAPAIEEERGDRSSTPVPAEESGPPENAETPEQAETDLPDVESLTSDSDYTAFMKDGVPPALRRLALRKLWASDPAFNIIDEMVEYGEDYTSAGLVAEGLKSAWRPGKGYARDDLPAEDARDTAETAAGQREADKTSDADASRKTGDSEKEITQDNTEDPAPNEGEDLG